MWPLKFRTTLFDGIAYTVLGGCWLALGLTEHHGLARWERVGLSLLLFLAGASNFIGVWHRRSR